jgi:hypothetical protein
MCLEKMAESTEPSAEQFKMPKSKPKNGRINFRRRGQSPLTPAAMSSFGYGTMRGEWSVMKSAALIGLGIAKIGSNLTRCISSSRAD